MEDTLVPIFDLPWSEPAIPAYRGTRVGPWTLRPTPALRKPSYGYFTVVKKQPPGWVIRHNDEMTWMSLSRMEVESHMSHFEAAQGRVVVMGFGMGFALYNIIRRPQVTHVTVVEQNPFIVELISRGANWQKWPGAGKIDVVVGDALTYRPEGRIDFLYADIWPLMFDENALVQTQQMQENVQAKLVGYWTQEADYVQWSRNVSGEPSQRTYRKFAQQTGLPLIEQDNARYPHLAFAALSLQLAASCPDQDMKNKLFARYIQHMTMQTIDPINRVLVERAREAQQKAFLAIPR